MSVVDSLEASYSSGTSLCSPSISVSSVVIDQPDDEVDFSRCSSPAGEDGEDIWCLRMKNVDDHPWYSDIDAINFEVNRDICMSGALIYRPFDKVEEDEEEESYKLQIYHTRSGKIISEQSVNVLEETNQPQIGIFKAVNYFRGPTSSARKPEGQLSC